MNPFAETALFLALVATACSRSEAPTPSSENTPPTAEQKRAQGDEILKQMAGKLKSATALTFSTSESNERVRRNNEKVTIKLERQVALRRPDRLWFKATGDRDLEGVYNGKVVMLITHKDKVFGEFPAPPTLEETADAITSKYGIALPIADLLSYDPKQSLLDTKTTGGWQGREAIEGVECNVLAYQHPNVDFSIWIPASGDPIPKKLAISYKARRGQPKSTILFRDWNLSPQLSDETFARKVPPDYEGIPVIQRAPAVLGQPGEQKQQGQPQAGGAPSQPKAE